MNGTKLAHLRQAKGWTQQQLAVRAGLHAMTVSSVERNAAEPELTTLRALARALGVDLAELLAEPDPAPSEVAS